jgi:hypothetical protein
MKIFMGRLMYKAVIGFVACALYSCAEKKPEKIIQANNMRAYLVQAAADITDNSLSNIRSLADWQNIQKQRYNEFIEMMGIEKLPLKGNRSPLNVHITGTLQKDGYRIEKLYYESLPSLYVCANLYIPDDIKEPRPAILYVCGHSLTQKVHYQAHPRKFAQLGFVCLIIETIQWGEVRGEHWGPYANGCFHWYSRGYNPGGVELWNAIRGLDLLAERPEVDPEKMGVTGISGGGSQSFYIAAADPRIKAVAPVCGASTLKAQVATHTIDGHCDCMMPINTFQQDFTDIGALIAPRPLLICQADRDGLNQVESVRTLYNIIAGIYKLYDASDKIGLVITPGGHSYHQISREKIFSFFIEHLMGKNVSPEEAGDIELSEEKMFTEEELKVYVDGPPPDDKTTTIQDSFIQLPSPPDITSKTELITYRDSVKDFLKIKTFGAWPKAGHSFEPELEFRDLDGAKYGQKNYSFVSEPGWRLRVDIHFRNDSSQKKPLMIVLRNQDEDRWSSEAFIENLSGDWNIAFFEVRGAGEFGWDPGFQWHIRRASAWTGRTVASMQVYDVLRCMKFCRTIEGVDADRIGIAARDEMAVVAMYAALMDGNCHTLLMQNPPETQNKPSQPDGRGASIEMLNCLKVTDIYQLPALLTPTTISFMGEIPPAFKWSETTLQKLGEKGFTSFDKI